MKHLQGPVHPAIPIKISGTFSDQPHALGVRFQGDGGAGDVEDEPIPEIPPCEEGVNLWTDQDSFWKCWDFWELFRLDKLTWTSGSSLTVGLSVNSTLIKGSQHSSVAALSQTWTIIFENQIMVGLAGHLINPDQEEFVSGWKKLSVAGWYIINGSGKNIKHIGTHEEDYPAISEKVLSKCTDKYTTAMTRVVATAMDEEAKEWDRVNKQLDNTYNNVTREINYQSSRIDSKTERIDEQKEKIGTLDANFGSMKETSSGKFQEIVAAAKEFKNSATTKTQYQSKLKANASDFVKFAAAISKVGG